MRAYSICGYTHWMMGGGGCDRENECIEFEEQQKEKSKMSESVNHPSHYNQGKIEVIEFIEDKKLGFNLGNAVKYISRAGVKDPCKHVEDLEKAVWYLKREIELVKSFALGEEPCRLNDMNERMVTK
jgi:uncharacterized protein DUF3310